MPSPVALQVLTYSGITGTAFAPPYREVMYVNGRQSTTIDNRVLSIVRNTNITVGAFVGSVAASQIYIARLRIHDGCLSPDQVFYNYVTEGSYSGMVPSPSNTPSVSSTASLTASSSQTRSATYTPTATRTASQTGSIPASISMSATGTRTPSPTGSDTPSVSNTFTPSRTQVSTTSPTRR